MTLMTATAATVDVDVADEKTPAPVDFLPIAIDPMADAPADFGGVTTPSWHVLLPGDLPGDLPVPAMGSNVRPVQSSQSSTQPAECAVEMP